MSSLIKPMLAKLALITTLFGGAEQAIAGHFDPPSFRVKVKFGGCNSGGSFWHKPVVPRPTYRIVYEQVWFAPVYESRVVGYTSCGKPIHRRVCVTAGHYKTAVYKVGSCGKKEFLHYI
jgi:hypothetical protein